MIFAKHWAASLDDYAIDLAWSPDGSLLAAASAAGGVTLFDAATGAVRHTLAGHADGANCLAWSPDGKLLASGGQDGCVRLWDPVAGTQSAEVKIGTAWVEHLCWTSSGEAATSPPSARAGVGAAPVLLFASAGRKLVALTPSATIAHTFPDAPKTISALAPSPSSVVSPPSSVLAAACFGHVALWDTRTFAAVKEFPYGNAIYALTWSPDGRWLVAGCHDNAVHLWAPAEADLELHMSGYESRLKELSFSHDSKWLATGGGRDACVWDCAGAGPEGREPLTLPHGARVCAVAFQHAHGLLAAGSANGEFTLWMPSRKNPMVAEVTMPAAATKFAWRHDDTLLAVGTEQGHLFVFKTV
jgi:WD40 repeat protein